MTDIESYNQMGIFPAHGAWKSCLSKIPLLHHHLIPCLGVSSVPCISSTPYNYNCNDMYCFLFADFWVVRNTYLRIEKQSGTRNYVTLILEILFGSTPYL